MSLVLRLIIVPIVLSFVLILSALTTATAQPVVSLSQLSDGACSSDQLIKQQPCVVAAREACALATHGEDPNARGRRFTFGLAQAVELDTARIECLSGIYYEIAGPTLGDYHPDCAMDSGDVGASSQLAQGRGCLAAARRFCREQGWQFGLITAMQITPDPSLQIGVHCGNALWDDRVDFEVLSAFQPDCNAAGMIQSAACMSAISTYCIDNEQAAGGLAQEVLRDGIGVACFESETTIHPTFN